jgi:branched-chain amino acid transport system ATP-binding protein
MTIFKTIDVTHYFGGLRALSNFNIEFSAGDIVGLIGPNGAGKTTAFNCVSGIYAPTSGRIFFNNLDITGMPGHKIARIGIARTFQNIRLFGDLSCIDNIKVAAGTRLNYGLFSTFIHTPAFWKQEQHLDDYCYGLLKMFDLHHKAADRASSLPYGRQRRLEIARALATQPKLLLLDEPAAGMNPAETRDLMDIILRVKREFNLTILIIEHNMHLIMNICRSVLVMDFGETIARGTPDEVRADPAVIAAYLGKQEEDGHAA